MRKIKKDPLWIVLHNYGGEWPGSKGGCWPNVTVIPAWFAHGAVPSWMRKICNLMANWHAASVKPKLLTPDEISTYLNTINNVSSIFRFQAGLLAGWVRPRKTDTDSPRKSPLRHHFPAQIFRVAPLPEIPPDQKLVNQVRLHNPAYHIISSPCGNRLNIIVEPLALEQPCFYWVNLGSYFWKSWQTCNVVVCDRHGTWCHSNVLDKLWAIMPCDMRNTFERSFTVF